MVTTKEKLILQINDMLLERKTEEEILKHFGIKLSKSIRTDLISKQKFVHYVAKKGNSETLVHYPNSNSWQLNTIIKTLFPKGKHDTFK